MNATSKPNLNLFGHESIRTKQKTTITTSLQTLHNIPFCHTFILYFLLLLLLPLLLFFLLFWRERVVLLLSFVCLFVSCFDQTFFWQTTKQIQRRILGSLWQKCVHEHVPVPKCSFLWSPRNVSYRSVDFFRTCSVSRRKLPRLGYTNATYGTRSTVREDCHYCLAVSSNCNLCLEKKVLVSIHVTGIQAVAWLLWKSPWQPQ